MYTQFSLKKMQEMLYKNPMYFLLYILLMTIIIVGTAVILSLFTFFTINYFSNENNTSINTISFLNHNSSDFVSIFTTSLLTTVLIIFSALSLSSAQDTLKQSEKQQKQFQNEQRIRDIEKRLEYFCIPADDIINSLSNMHVKSIFGYSNSGYERLKDIGKYSYLASVETYKAYENYMTAKCAMIETTKCPYELKNISECKDYTNNCEYSFPECIKTVIHCEYYDECTIKDQSNDFICKYCKSLKEKLTRDIKDYKNKLVRLKE